MAMSDVRAGFAAMFGATYYTGNHASFEGARIPPDSSILRIARACGGASDE